MATMEIKVDQNRYSVVEKNLEKLNKKIWKIDSGVQITIVDRKLSYFQVNKVTKSRRELLDGVKADPNEPIFESCTYVFDYPEPRINIPGHRLIAKLEFMGEHTIVTTLGEEAGIDYTPFYSEKPFCEHCSARRPKKASLMFLRESDNKFVQLGFNCASKYFGLDVDRQLSLLDINWSALGGDDDEDEFWGHYDREAANHREFMTCMMFAPFVLNKHGFVGRSQSSDYSGVQSTYDRVTQLAFWLKDLSSYSNERLVEEFPTYRDELPNFRIIRDQFFAEMDTKVITPEMSSFEKNALAAVKARSLKHLSFVLPLLRTWMNADQGDTTRLPNYFNSEFLGNVGEKVETTGYVVSRKTLDNGYDTTLLKIVTEDGNLITWFASSVSDDVVRRCKVEITGKIKDLSVYENVKQTVLTRCKLLVIEAPKN